MSRDNTWRDENLYRYGLETSVGVAVGVGAAMAYYGIVYLPINEQIHDDREDIERLESDANSFIVTRDHLEDQDMLAFGQNFYLTETASTMATEAQEIRDTTPNQSVEQLMHVGVGLGAGVLAFTVCLVGRNAFRKYQDHKHSKSSEEYIFTTPKYRKEHKTEMKKVKDTIEKHTDDDDFTPPPAA